ncbi:MAG: hypothetical protein HY243_15705 [Proteobacteria bacterium]|nr:hypothetical protein [Pseudomonadota bacterium]
MAIGVFRLCFKAGALVAAAMLLSTHAFAVGERETVTIKSDKRNTPPPKVRTMPPSSIPVVQAPITRIDPVNANPKVGFGASGGPGGQLGFQGGGNTGVSRAANIDTARAPPPGSGTSGR